MEQYEKLTDEQLIEKLHSGDRDVTDYLMEKYKMMVRKKARSEEKQKILFRKA